MNALNDKLYNNYIQIKLIKIVKGVFFEDILLIHICGINIRSSQQV